MARAFGGPNKYIQRAGEIDKLAAYLAPLGKRALVLIDRVLFDALSERIGKSCGDSLDIRFERFGGECCTSEIERVRKVAIDQGSDILVGVGGGKTADTAKIVAIDTGARIVIAPTIASTDAPCSAFCPCGASRLYWKSTERGWLFQTPAPFSIAVPTSP